ncbi:MAG TPA: glucose 1-dehydrogenase [Acidimicrobiales bacterium]|jgi:NAD(P)-dependent dehydrogenase (short-subunit alcohol dehydrogenase family)|nr:glucose 1-dehydrogenase [Acidimicrobiales bacterium]
MGRIDGKVAIVTGAAMGIGRASAVLLAREGARVAVTDIESEAGAETVEEITKSGGEARFWHLDTSDEGSVSEAFAGVNDAFGRLDVLVNNAGIAGVTKPTHEISLEEWNSVISVNLSGVFLCTKHALPYMREAGGGSIVNLSSIYGIVGSAGAPAYHAAKGAVRIMSKTDALIYAADGIRVNSVHPGFIWTPMVESSLRKRGDMENERQRLEGLQPVGHMGEPDDIAYGVLYLASDEAKFVTGSELVIDGGYTAR